jgi:hypothetical protein
MAVAFSGGIVDSWRGILLPIGVWVKVILQERRKISELKSPEKPTKLLTREPLMMNFRSFLENVLTMNDEKI